MLEASARAEAEERRTQAKPKPKPAPVANVATRRPPPPFRARRDAAAPPPAAARRRSRRSPAARRRRPAGVARAFAFGRSRRQAGRRRASPNRRRPPPQRLRPRPSRRRSTTSRSRRSTDKQKGRPEGRPIVSSSRFTPPACLPARRPERLDRLAPQPGSESPAASAPRALRAPGRYAAARSRHVACVAVTWSARWKRRSKARAAMP